MSVSSDTKVCPLCAEIIKTTAKVCPFCRSKQGRCALWRQELPVAVTGLALLSMAVVMIAWLTPEEEGVGGRSFAGNRNELVVLNTTLDPLKAKPAFWLTGVITNRGQHPWRVHELEVRFVDHRGNLLDARHPVVKELFVVLPRQEQGFRVELGELVFTNKNVTHQVRVQVATDGDRPSKPN